MATNIYLFWENYHNLVVGIMVFLLTFFTISLRKDLIGAYWRLIILTGIFMIIFELSLYFFPSIVMNLIKNVLQKEVLDGYLTNLFRGRLPVENNTEIFLPFFLTFLISQFFYSRKTKKYVSNHIYFSFLAISNIFLAIASNFRSRLVSLIFIISSYSYVIYSNFLKKTYVFKKALLLIVILCLVLFAILKIGLGVSNYLYSYNILDRLSLSNQSGDLITVKFRIRAALNSLILFKSSPFFGVGLGNYFDKQVFRQINSGISLIGQNYKKNYALGAAFLPHNIIFQTLAETGLLGLISYLMLIIYFFIKDFKRIKLANRTDLIPYIVSSWTIFIFMNLNPGPTIFIMGWFWFLRGIIEASKSHI
jgi:hypothetical protein